MNLNQLLSLSGHREARKRRGRGEGSGLGKTSGRGNKGAKARSGWRRRYGYEGGQMPLSRRVPKRGFNNFNFATYFDVINVGDLGEVFEDGAMVDRAALLQRGLFKPRFERVKLLGGGTISKKLVVVVDAASAGARQKIEAAGGTLQCLMPPRKVHKPFVPRTAPAQPPPAEEGGEKKKDKGEKAEKKKADKGAEAAAKQGGGQEGKKKDKAPQAKSEKKGEKGGEGK